MNTNRDDNDLPVIFSYTRAQALQDGVLIDVSDTAREAGIKFPTAVTRAVWARYVEVPEGTTGQDERGRLWDVIWMLRDAIRKSDGGERIDYRLYVALPDRGDWQSNEAVPKRSSRLNRQTHRLVTLKALCGPGDDAEPVITIMLPDED
jgi:hypothetical protein